MLAEDAPRIAADLAVGHEGRSTPSMQDWLDGLLHDGWAEGSYAYGDQRAGPNGRVSRSNGLVTNRSRAVGTRETADSRRHAVRVHRRRAGRVQVIVELTAATPPSPTPTRPTRHCRPSCSTRRPPSASCPEGRSTRWTRATTSSATPTPATQPLLQANANRVARLPCRSPCGCRPSPAAGACRRPGPWNALSNGSPSIVSAHLARAPSCRRTSAAPVPTTHVHAPLLSPF